MFSSTPFCVWYTKLDFPCITPEHIIYHTHTKAESSNPSPISIFFQTGASRNAGASLGVCHTAGRACNASTICLPNTLMTHADSEQRHFGAERFNDLKRYPRIFWPACEFQRSTSSFFLAAAPQGGGLSQ